MTITGLPDFMKHNVPPANSFTLNKEDDLDLVGYFYTVEVKA